MAKKQKDIFSFIRYANCWEDSAVLRKALKIQSGERGVSIASAGDNTLALLLDDPSEIIAFDLNETQLFCVELKMAAFCALSYPEMLEFIGVRKSKQRLALYKKTRKYMSQSAAEYFDADLALIKRGIMHSGKFENYFRLFRLFVIPLFTTRQSCERFTSLCDPKEQESYYRKHLDNRRLRLLFGIYFGKRVMGRLGRDKSFYRYVDDSDNVAVRIKKRFELGVSNVPNATNPYLKYVLCNRFEEAALPEYLKRENFETIRNRLGRIKLVKGDLLSLYENDYDFFNLSDIFEYMSDDEFERNVAHIVGNSASQARVAYWNMQGNKYIDKKKLTYQRELSEKLFVSDRAFFYKDFRVYVKEDI